MIFYNFSKILNYIFFLKQIKLLFEIKYLRYYHNIIYYFKLF